MAFDLDDEELKATRMMNGADRKGRINKMEQDIEILERMLKIEKECLHYDVSQDEIRAIEHLIKAYKELEEENRIFALEGSRVRLKIHIDKNYIPVSLVEEKIEEIDKIYKCIPEDEGNFAKAILIKEKQVLQELLEKRK